MTAPLTVSRVRNAAIVVVVAILAGYGLQSFTETTVPPKPENPFPGLQAADFKEEAKKWEGEIDTIGAQQAYQNFKASYQEAGFGTQHAAAHVFGEILYDKEGLAGVAVCDSEFAFGCYHSFFGKAITQNGLSILPQLDNECIRTYGEGVPACPHGIGHGVLSYLGYDSLSESLRACEKLSWKGPIGGCTSGVFMEYNFRTMESPDGIAHRPFSKDAAHAPCTDVPEDFLEACYFEQPSWWSAVHVSPEKGYRAAAELCAEVSPGASRTACFRGLGNVIAGIGRHDIETVLTYCAFSPTQDVAECLQGAAWIAKSLPEHTDSWEELCDSLSGAERLACVSS